MVYRHNQIVKKEMSKLLLFGLAAVLSLSILSTTAKRADAIAPSCSFTPSGSVDTLNDDCYVSSRYTVPAGRTLDGDGHTMYPTFSWTSHSNNATLEIEDDNVTVKNLTIEGSGGTDLHGINIYEADNVTIDNVTVINNGRSGIVVNSSAVSVSDVTTAGNLWNGINVDQKTLEPSVLNIVGPMHQTDFLHIKVDDTSKSVTVNDTLTQYGFVDYGVVRIYTLDTTPPTTPTIITPIDDDSFPTQPIFGDWTDSTDANGIDKYEIEYVYDDGHTFAGGPYRETPGTQSWRNHTPALWEQGGVTIRVRAYDPAGNMSGWSNSVHYYYDYEAPSVPVLTSPIGYTNDNTPLMQWDDSTDSSGIAGYYYRVYYNCSDEGNVSASCSSLYPNATGVWRVPSEYQAGTTNDGTYFWQVMAEDNAGNQSAWSGFEKVTIDTLAPNKVAGVTIHKGASTAANNLGCSGFTNDRQITVDWDDSTDINFDYYRYKVKNGWSTTLVPSQRTGIITDLDGEYKYQVQAVDKAGNVGDYSDWCYVTLDRVAPVTSALTSPVDTSVWGTPITITGETADLNGVDFVNIYYRTAGTADPFVLAGVSPVDNAANDSPFAWTTDWTPPADGIYDIKAGGVDMAGNEEASVYAYDVTYDSTAPTTVNAGVDRGSQSAPFSHTGTADDGSGSGIASTVWSKTSGPGNILATGETTLTPTFSADTDGTYVVRLTATDNAGNSAYDEFSFTWFTPALPQAVLGATTAGGGSTGTGGADTFVAVTYLEPTTNDNDGQVDGDKDVNDSTQGEVLQTTNDDAEQSEVDEGCFEILGLCWYWWIAIAAAIALMYYIYRVFNEDEEEKK